MTNPVLLLGTQSNGETLPVQVDAFGRLVAEGLQGSEGPEGPEGPPGPEGPEGPPGEGIPMDGEQGDVLTWIDGGPAWGNPQPSVIVWPNYLAAPGGFQEGYGPENAFDGTSSEASTKDLQGRIVLTIPFNTQILQFGFKTANSDTSMPYKFELNGISQDVDDTGVGGDWSYVTRFMGQNVTAGDKITFYRMNPGGVTGVRAFSLNGVELMYQPNLKRMIAEEVLRTVAEMKQASQGGIIPTSDIDPS